MSNPEILLYAGNDMLPGNIDTVIDEVKTSGVNHLVLSLCHIGPDGSVLWLNEAPFIGVEGLMPVFEGWQAQLQQILDGGIVNKISASFGGALEYVHDFRRVEAIYKGNNNSFAGTLLESSFKTMKKSLPAITCIDMDNEEFNDKVSFVAFCKMLQEIGFELSFCVYGEKGNPGFNFWMDCFQEIEQTWGKGSVKRLNVQAYADECASPRVWASAIKERIKGFDTTKFINVGFEAAWNSSGDYWRGMTPVIIETSYPYYAAMPEVNGAFFWNYDLIRKSTLVPKPKKPDSNDQYGYLILKDYVMAIWNGMVTDMQPLHPPR